MHAIFDLTRWFPLGTSSNPFQLHREIDEPFTRFFGQHPTSSGAANGGSAPMWSPAVESWTSKGHLTSGWRFQIEGSIEGSTGTQKAIRAS
jgi:hypothetical protein